MIDQGDETDKVNDDFLQDENEPKALLATEQEEHDDPRPWRELFFPEIEPIRDVLFTTELKIRIADLPLWVPDIMINPRWADDGDD